MALVLGIDAGGSKTTGFVVDQGGQVVGRAERGGANLSIHGELAVEKVLHDVLEALRPAGAPGAVCVGMAGVDRPGEHQTVEGILRRLGLQAPTLVVHDAAIALAAGAPRRVGIVVLSGTGSIAYGRDPSGRTARAGGWGPVLADEGSAFWLGQEALRRATRALDGRGPTTSLTAFLFEALGLRQLEQLVPRVYDRELSRAELASLAPCVERAAAHGDAVARELLGAAGQSLARCAGAVARQLDFASGGPVVVLAGGCFQACPSLIGHVERALDVPGSQPCRLSREPALGAAALARELLERGGG